MRTRGHERADGGALPVWEPTLGSEMGDPRLSKMMLSREGVTMTAAFFRKQGTGLFARCPGSTWVGESEKYPLGLRGIREPDPIRLEDMVLYERERGALVENTRRLLDGRRPATSCSTATRGRANPRRSRRC